jgi:anaerobic magnesium-protoporphyrin IX monomethyl ester cyclase
LNILLTGSPIFETQKDAKDIDIDLEKKTFGPSMALYQLASIIREKHQVQVLDPAISNFKSADNGFIGIFDDQKLSTLRFPILERSLKAAEAVGISSTSFDWFLARVMAQRIKELDPDLPIIAGGIHPSIADSFILDSSKVDYVVRGEGERALPELLNALEKGGDIKAIKGVSWRINGSVIRNEDRPPLTAEEMEENPLPAFDLMPSNVYGRICVETSRGCKSDCKFCSAPFRRHWRGISPKAALRRIEHAADYSAKFYGNKKKIIILDITFTADPKRSERILEGLKDIDLGNLGIAFEGRAEDIAGSNIMSLCQGLPIDYIYIGVECGYNGGLQKIGKGTSVETVERCASQGSDYHVSLRYGFIVGFPWETREECLKTIAFADRLVSDNGGLAFINWLYLLPGSRLWVDRGSYGVSEDLNTFERLHFFSKEYRLNVSSGLTEEDISDIDREIDKLNLMRLVNGSRADFARSSVPSGISKTAVDILTRTGSFIAKFLPYYEAETKLLNLELR